MLGKLEGELERRSIIVGLVIAFSQEAVDISNRSSHGEELVKSIPRADLEITRSVDSVSG